MPKIAIVSKCPPLKRPYNWAGALGVSDFDELYLCSTIIDKMKVADIDLDLEVLKYYDIVLLVGAEPCKVVVKLSGSVTEFQGSIIDEKFIPIINPNMLYFKPQLESGFQAAIIKIKTFMNGTSMVASTDYKGITDPVEALQYVDWLDKNFDVVAVDTEGTALYPRDGYTIGISLSGNLETGRYIDANIVEGELHNKLQKLFLDKQIVFQNAKYDLSMLIYHFNFKFHTDYRHPKCYHDTMLMHYALDENNGHGLKELAVKYTNLGFYEKDLDEFKSNYCRTHKIKKEQFTYDLIPFDVLSSYAAKDTSATIALYNIFYPILLKNERIMKMYRTLLIRGTTFLMNVQEAGVPFSETELEKAASILQAKYDEAMLGIYEHKEVHDFEEAAGVKFNPNSVFHLRSLLFDYCKLPVSGKLTATGNLATDAEVLDDLAKLHPVPALITTAKKTKKLLSTYIYKAMQYLDRDGRLRTNFNLHIATSGRLSSSGKLNLQQLPRDDKTVKACIRARKGYKIVACDLSTAEMYIAAVLSGDKRLQEVFTKGGDFHTEMAIQAFSLSVPDEVELAALRDRGFIEAATRRCFIETYYTGKRQAAKAVSFGILFGAGPETVAEQAGISMSEAKESIKIYFQKFSKLKQWLDNTAQTIEKQGYVYTFFGRKRRLLNAKSADKGLKAHDIRSGTNALIQSASSDVNLIGAMDSYDELVNLGLDFKMFALVHDSIVSEVKDEDVDEYIKVVRYNLQKDMGLSIPGFPIGVDFDVSQNYAGTEEL